MAVAGCATIAWLGLYGFAWTDYEVEARPAFEALAHGHLDAFLRLAPAYGGSLVERAPFALLPGLWGGGPLALYRSVAIPCLLAAGILGIVLVARMRARGASRLARAVTLGICVANPITLLALEVGHPEDLLGACLCVAAVLLAAGRGEGRARPLLAGVAIGLAIANKEWALLALGPVLLALPAGRRWPCLATAALVAGVILAPLALAASGGFTASTRAVASAPSAIFQPWQLWWFFGHHGALVHGMFGTPKPGYRVGPEWTGKISHPLILLVGAALTLALWPRSRGGSLSEQDALLALAFVFLLRCLLDTWDTVYYALPFILALLSWEVGRAGRRPPVLALTATVLVWLSFQWLPAHVGADAQAALFLAWSLPLALWLGVSLFAPRRLEPGRRLAPERPQAITVSSLLRPVSTSRPPSLTTTRSSMRTPSSPGR